MRFYGPLPIFTDGFLLEDVFLGNLLLENGENDRPFNCAELSPCCANRGPGLNWGRPWRGRGLSQGLKPPPTPLGALGLCPRPWREGKRPPLFI